MAGLPFWDGSGGLDDYAWETAWLGGYYLPGLVHVEWVTPPKRRIEKKAVKGQDGTTVTDQGDELAELLIQVQVYTAEQWAQWQETLPLLWAKKDGGDRNPLEFMHPLPNLMGIKDVYIEQIKPSHPENQIMTIEIRVFEWKPNPKPVTNAAGRGTTNLVGGAVTNAAKEATRAVGEIIGFFR